MERTELLSQQDTFIFSEEVKNSLLLNQLEEEQEIVSIAHGVYYRGIPTLQGITPPPQEDVLRLLLPAGWGYTGWSASNRLEASTRIPAVTEVSVPKACSLPESVTSYVKPHRYGRNLLSPMEVAVLETLESYPTYVDCSLPELITKCRQVIPSSESARLISCTVNEPTMVRDRLITVLSI